MTLDIGARVRLTEDVPLFHNISKVMRCGAVGTVTSAIDGYALVCLDDYFQMTVVFRVDQLELL
jgi:hypothetical protein